MPLSGNLKAGLHFWRTSRSVIGSKLLGEDYGNIRSQSVSVWLVVNIRNCDQGLSFFEVSGTLFTWLVAMSCQEL